jgi:hypothetical protein
MSDQHRHPPGLVTEEGVDEGSAASTAEGPAPRSAANGVAPRGEPADATDPAPPDGTTATGRPSDTRGQALEVGEG